MMVYNHLRDRHEQNDFFRKMKKSRHVWLEVIERIKHWYQRRKYKVEILQYYWKMIVKRCKILTNRDQIDEIKEFNGHKFDRISIYKK